jgi:hypothetical protein
MRLRYVEHCTLLQVWDYWRNKADGAHNRLENDRGAWVTLCAHATHTDADMHI